MRNNDLERLAAEIARQKQLEAKTRRLVKGSLKSWFLDKTKKFLSADQGQQTSVGLTTPSEENQNLNASGR